MFKRALTIIGVIGLATGILAAVLGLMPTSFAEAASFVVTSTADGGAGSLRNAIADANSASGLDTVTFDPALAGQIITLTSGAITVSDDLIVEGPGALSMTIRGDGGGIFHAIGAGRFSVEGITLARAGQTIVISSGVEFHLSDSVIRDGGTGVLLTGSTRSRITNTLFVGHSNSAIVANSHDGIIRDSQIISNSAARGGGMRLLGTSTWVIEDTVIAENNADEEGGGVLVDSGAKLLVTESYIVSNTAGFGAGLANMTGTVHIENSAIAWNRAITGGGGLYEFSLASMFITDTLVRGNEAGFGGGLYVDHGRALIAGSTFADNWALGGVFGMEGVGGGIYAGSGLTALDSEVNLTNSTLSGNHATWNGGGIGMGEADFHLRNVTITGNEVDFDGSGKGDGGGLAQFGISTVQLDNTIIGGNSDSGGEAPDCAAVSPMGTGITSLGYNLIEDTAGCAFTPVVGDVFGQDPLLDGSLTNNGGPTPTHALLPGSPAIDSGDCSGWTVLQDQRGVARGVVSACDIGAFEVGYAVQLPIVAR